MAQTYGQNKDQSPLHSQQLNPVISLILPIISQILWLKRGPKSKKIPIMKFSRFAEYKNKFSKNSRLSITKPQWIQISGEKTEFSEKKQFFQLLY